jgi:hypothetical protein
MIAPGMFTFPFWDLIRRPPGPSRRHRLPQRDARGDRRDATIAQREAEIQKLERLIWYARSTRCRRRDRMTPSREVDALPGTHARESYPDCPVSSRSSPAWPGMLTE